MSIVKRLIKISRPHFWFYLLGPYLLGVVAGNFLLNNYSLWDIVLWGFYFLFPANLFIYGINDIFDYETDKLNIKKQSYEQLLPPQERAFLITAILITSLPWIFALLFANLGVQTSIVLFIFLGLFYSAPPLRAKAKPVIDSLFNVLYIFPALVGYFLTGALALQWPILVAAGLWTMAMHAYSAIPDIEADFQAGIQTIATYFGKNRTLLFCTLCYLISSFIAAVYIGTVGYLLGIVYLIMMRLTFQKQSTSAMLKLYKYFPIINMGAGFILFLTILLTKVN